MKNFKFNDVESIDIPGSCSFWLTFLGGILIGIIVAGVAGGIIVMTVT